ncbi:hypothetical protein [Lichenicola sp.]|uniref:hypothetical protein n=1 Tax=Lichenicola sp. TaxID=2804529 RepID=UPI003B00E876
MPGYPIGLFHLDIDQVQTAEGADQDVPVGNLQRDLALDGLVYDVPTGQVEVVVPGTLLRPWARRRTMMAGAAGLA